jgi:hypothetical protein
MGSYTMNITMSFESEEAAEVAIDEMSLVDPYKYMDPQVNGREVFIVDTLVSGRVESTIRPLVSLVKAFGLASVKVDLEED